MQVPLSSQAGILNLDHYKYLRSLLPPVPHFIESLSFTDLNSWTCQIYVNLSTESDCIKWLTDFEEKTSTSWRSDAEASRLLALTARVPGSWLQVYRCLPTESRKECGAQLEMKILGEQRGESVRTKQYPCQVLLVCISLIPDKCCSGRLTSTSTTATAPAAPPPSSPWRASSPGTSRAT